MEIDGPGLAAKYGPTEGDSLDLYRSSFFDYPLTGETVFYRAMLAARDVAWWHLLYFKPGDRVMLAHDPDMEIHARSNAMTAMIYGRGGTVARMTRRGQWIVNWDNKKRPSCHGAWELIWDDPASRAARTKKETAKTAAVIRAIAAAERAMTERAAPEAVALAVIKAYRTKG